MCTTLTAYTNVTSDNTMSTRTLNSQYADINESLGAKRLYTHGNIYSQAMINAFDGFRLTSTDGATIFFNIQMDANSDVSYKLISNTNNIDFNIGGTNVGYFSPSDELYINRGNIFDETACIGYDALNNW